MIQLYLIESNTLIQLPYCCFGVDVAVAGGKPSGGLAATSLGRWPKPALQAPTAGFGTEGPRTVQRIAAVRWFEASIPGGFCGSRAKLKEFYRNFQPNPLSGSFLYLPV